MKRVVTTSDLQRFSVDGREYWRFSYTLATGKRRYKCVGPCKTVSHAEAKRRRTAFIRESVTSPARVIDGSRASTLMEWCRHVRRNCIGDLSDATQRIYSMAMRYLVVSMGKDTKITSITRESAQCFKADLMANRLGRAKLRKHHRDVKSPATVEKYIQYASAVLGEAVKAGKIDANPFRGVDVQVPAGKEDWTYVTSEQTHQILDACWNVHWRALVALCRWGGLRAGESRNLQWVDVHLGKREMNVYGSKVARTARKEGVTRLVPINDALLAILREARLARDGDRVCGNRMASGPQLSRTMRAIMERAGFEWESPLHDLRRSRAQDLANSNIPVKDAATMMGHSVAVMMRFYVKTTSEGFAKARAV